MLVLRRHRHCIPYKVVWFAPRKVRGLGPFVYRQAQFSKTPFGYRTTEFRTLHTDLTRSEQEVWSDLNATTRNLVSRARREGLTARVSTQERFLRVQEPFTVAMGLDRVAPEQLESMAHVLMLREVADEEGNPIATDALLVDPKGGRARYLYGARDLSNQHAKHAHYANRLLLWDSLLWAKSEGLRVFDWGGIAPSGSDRKLDHVNEFKYAFGGLAVTEFNHVPLGFR